MSLSCSHATAFLRDKIDITKSDPCWDLIERRGEERRGFSPLSLSSDSGLVDGFTGTFFGEAVVLGSAGYGVMDRGMSC